ncbi:MAG: YkvA family protein [Candidatus Levyibacteriota bacterium]
MKIARLKRVGRVFKSELKVYKLVLKDPKTPFSGKLFLALAVGYALMPFDLIPDFIPILGQLDDLIIVPLLVILALKMIPREIIDKYRKQVYGH